jgi:hypothetical protein
MFVMLLWVYIHTGQAWKICLATVEIEPTTFGIQHISHLAFSQFQLFFITYKTNDTAVYSSWIINEVFYAQLSYSYQKSYSGPYVWL